MASGSDLWSFLQERCSRRMFNKVRLLLNGYRRSAVGGWWMHPPSGHPQMDIGVIHLAIEQSTGIDFAATQPVSLSHIREDFPVLNVEAAREVACCQLIMMVCGTSSNPNVGDRIILERKPAAYLHQDTRDLLKKLCDKDAAAAVHSLLPKPLHYGKQLLPLLEHNISTLLYNACAPHLCEPQVSRAEEFEEAVRMLDQVLFIGAQHDDVGTAFWLEP